MHPVQHDLWCTVPACGHVAGHLIISVPRQTKVQNLGAIEVQKRELCLQNNSHFVDCGWYFKWEQQFTDLKLAVFIHRQITRFQILKAIEVN